jgi:hypothetical protein
VEGCQAVGIVEAPSGWRESPLGFVKKLGFSLQSILTYVKEKGSFFTKGKKPSIAELAAGSVMNLPKCRF